jgi:hypothetical protein
MSENLANEPVKDTAEKIVSTESTTEKITAAADKLAAEAGKAWDIVEDKAEALWDKAKSGELTKEANEKLDDLKEGAEKLWDKAKSGELTAEAKDKLEDLKEGAGKFWDKIVDKFDGDDVPEKKAE